jgi:hypothetical protein
MKASPLSDSNKPLNAADCSAEVPVGTAANNPPLMSGPLKIDRRLISNGGKTDAVDRGVVAGNKAIIVIRVSAATTREFAEAVARTTALELI